jgi:hypothetical protein
LRGLERDGWAPYRRFKQARHQTCYAHLLKRAGELIDDSIAGQARVPHAFRRLLKNALKLREQHDRLLSNPEGVDADVIDAQEFGLRVQKLKQRADELLEITPTHEPNCRLLAHLRTEREHMSMAVQQPSPSPRPRYQVICYELTGEQRNLIMDVTDDGSIAATGSITNDIIDVELAHAVPHELQAHLALAIANDKQLLDDHAPRRRTR